MEQTHTGIRGSDLVVLKNLPKIWNPKGEKAPREDSSEK